MPMVSQAERRVMYTFSFMQTLLYHNPLSQGASVALILLQHLLNVYVCMCLDVSAISYMELKVFRILNMYTKHLSS